MEGWFVIKFSGLHAKNKKNMRYSYIPGKNLPIFIENEHTNFIYCAEKGFNMRSDVVVMITRMELHVILIESQ